MARKRKEDEYKSYNSGGVGYSEKALAALNRGTYGKEYGRQAQYRTSQEQTQQTNNLPVLKGVTVPTSTSNDFESSFGRKNYVDTDRARRKYAEKLSKPSSRYNNESIQKDLSKPKKSNRDTKYDKDFDEFYEWRYNKLGVMPDYDPATGNNVEHWEQVKKDIMAKNKWTEKEFEAKWKEYDDERSQKMADEEVQTAINFAKEHPAMGTAVQAAYTPQTWIEGLSTAVQGLGSRIGKITGKNPVENHMAKTANDTKLTGTRVKEGIKQEVRDNHIKTGVGKALYEGGTGFVDWAESSVMPGGALWMGASKAASKQRQNLERGVDADKAAESATLSGIGSAILNKKGLDSVLNKTGKTVIGTLAKGANIEGLENVAEDTIDMAIDKFINGDKSELNTLHDYYVNQGGNENAWGKVVKDKLRELATSYGSGAVMGGLVSAVNHVPDLADYASQKWANSKLNAIDENYQKILADALGVPEESITAPRISAKSDAELGEQSKNISKQLQKMADGEMASNEYVTLGETPRYMQEYGDVNNPLVMPQNVVTKHGLDEAVVENLPQQFNNPVAVMRSRTQPNSGVVMTDIVDEHGNPVIVPIHMDKETDMGIVNEVPSAYGKKGAKNFINNSEVAFENKERVNEALSGNGVRFSELNGSNNPNFNSKIGQNAQNVNGADIPPVNANNTPNGPENPNLKQSRVVTNTAINSDVISRYEYDNDPVLKEIASYAAHNNETTYNNALDNVKKNGATLLDEYNSDKRAIDNDQDVDQGMILLRNLKEQIKTASPEDAELLTIQRNMLLSKLRQAGTNYGEAIQAFAKWNDTPDGALINGERILNDSKSAWESRNQTQVKKNEKIAKDLSDITSSRLDKALRNMGNDGSMEGAPKAPKTHEQHRIEVENSIRKELGSVAEQFGDNDFDFLTSLVENKIPVDIITDEIEHRLNHGEWYTLDESTPIKKATSSKLAKILKDMGDDSLKSKNNVPEYKGDIAYPQKSHATIVNEVANTLEGEAAALGLDSPTDVEFIATMLEEKIPAWKIEDEINHRLMTGEWYTLDESIEAPKPTSQKLKNALNSLVEEEVASEKTELSLDEIREQVRNTLDNESASEGEFSEEDVNYLANLIKSGATKQELAQALNTKLATGRFGISQDTQTKVNTLFDYADKFDPDSKQACEARAAAYKLIAEEVVGDASPFEKYEAWRYLAMLGNPKTMLRNLVGNGMFNAVTGVSNNIAAVLESAVDKTSRAFGGNGIQRTKAVLNPSKDGALIKGAWNDAPNKRFRQLSGTKYEKGNMRDAIKSEKSVFNSKAMQGVESVVDKGISDYTAVRAKYSTSLAGWMKANGLDASAFDAEPRYKNLQAESRVRLLTDAEKAEMASLKETMDALEKGRDYAQKAAEYATFHEDNAIADFLSKQSRELMTSDNRGKRALGYIFEGIIPFKKTPANILKSGVEFSPLGAIDSIKKTGKLIYENTGKRKENLGDTYTKKSWWRGEGQEVERTLASDVIDSWAKSLTGTGLAGLGYYLMSKGVLNSSDDGEKYQDDLEGIQNYSITINGKTYTVDWAAPAVMPLLLGAEMKKIFDRHAIPDEKWYGDIDEVVASVNSLLDPMFETSMLQGIQNVMESAANEFKYNDDKSAALGGVLGAMTTNAATGYLTQALPTLSGQIARTVDPIRRATDTATNSNFLGGIEKQGRKLMNKIPWLSELNPVYRDAYGRTQNNSPFDNPFANFAYQSLSPAYISDINTTDADTMARDVYNATTFDAEGREVPIKDKDVFAPWKNKVTYSGEKLSPEQMEVYRKASGEASYAIRDALANEDWFKELNGDKQTEILKSLKSLVNKVGLEANGFPQTGKEYETYQKGGVPALLNTFKSSAENKKITEATGLTTSSNAAKSIKADMEAGNTQAAEQKIDEATQLKNLGFTKPGPTDTYYKAKEINPSITTDEFAKTYKAIDADGNQGIKQDELISYFNKNHFTSEEEAMKVWNMYAPKGKKVPYLKKDGTWGKH